MRTLSIFIHKIDPYFLVLITALFLGVIFAEYAVAIYPYIAYLLSAIFFLNALKINWHDILEYLHDRWMIVIVNMFMLIVLPIFVYYVTLKIFPLLAGAFLILSAMPSAMTSPLLTEINGGKQALAVVFVVSTSLLAPLTIPFVVKITMGAEIALSFYDMFIVLAKIIFIPFILAGITKYFLNNTVNMLKNSFNGISIVLLGFLTIGIVAKQADIIIESMQGGIYMLYIILLFVFFAFLHIVGYFVIFWRHKRDRVAITICLTYMNLTLAIYLADKFFTDPNIIIPVILAILPWTILLIPFKLLSQKLKFI